MNENNGSPTNKLILLVLTLILGCLVFMLVRGGTNLIEPPAQQSAARKSPASRPPAMDGEAEESAPRNTAAVGLPRPQPSAAKTSAPPVVVPAPPRPEPEIQPAVPAPGHFTGRLTEPPPAPPVEGVVTTRFTGGISGRVYLRGTPPPEKIIALDAVCGRLQPKGLMTRHYVVGEGKGLANVFVYLKEGAPTNFSIANDQTPLLDQIGCEYQPFVMGVRINQNFQIKNSDPVMHNVHATPNPGNGNKEFNFAQVRAGQVNAKSFARPEVFVRVKCDVHPWMFAYIGVAEHPWFAVTDADGYFVLPGKLPPGKYRLAAVHLKAGEQVQDVELTGDATQAVSFTLEVK